MRIAILSPFPPYRGGIAQFSQQLFQVLAKAHTVKAFSFSRLYPKILFPGESQLTEDEKEVVLAERLLDSIHPLSYCQTARKIEQFAPEILLISYWMPFFIPCFGVIASLLKKKTILIFLLHNALSHESFKLEKPLATWLFKKGKGFMLMSDQVKNDLLHLHSTAVYCQHPHPFPRHLGEKIDAFSARKTLQLSLKKKTLLFFGFIRSYKGLGLLLDAFSLLDDSYQLLIAGECYGSFEAYQKQIDSSYLKECIRVENRYIPESEIPIFFSAGDLLILPYKSATQSGVIAMAYHFELPILATDTGNFRETLETPGTGLICGLSARSLANGIKQFFALENSSFVRAIQLEKKHLSWEIFSDKLLEFGEQLKK